MQTNIIDGNSAPLPAGYTDQKNLIVKNGKIYFQIGGADLLELLIPKWVAGSYYAGFMVYEGTAPMYFYVCNINGTVTEPVTDFYAYNPAIPYNPGSKGWTQYSNLSWWIQNINVNSFGPG